MKKIKSIFRSVVLADSPLAYNQTSRFLAKIYLVGPVIGFFVLLALYFLAIFLGNYADLKNISSLYSIAYILFILDIYALVYFTYFSIFVIPAGLVLWFKKPLTKLDVGAGKGSLSSSPKELLEWNWGAAGWPVAWGLANFSFLGLIGLIPVVNLFWWIYMGKIGNRLAWQSNRWESLEHFTTFQNRWRLVGIAGVVFNVFALGMFIYRFLAYIGGY